MLGRVRQFLKQSRGERTVTARAEVVEREQKTKMGEVGNPPLLPSALLTKFQPKWSPCWTSNMPGMPPHSVFAFATVFPGSM